MALGNSNAGGGASLKPTDAFLRVQAPAGATVTISKGGTTKSDAGHANETDHGIYDYYFIIHQSQFDSINAWTVTATLGGSTESSTIIIDSADEYDVNLAFQYGAMWTKGTSSAWTRLGTSVGWSSPSPAVGTGSGSSPFDNVAPWSGMAEFNVINDRLAYQKGVDPEFSRTAYDTVVRIPKFYYQTAFNSSETHIRISPFPRAGFTEHPAFEGKDYIYVGRYLTASGYVSKSGLTPLVNVDRATVRANSRAHGIYPHWDMMNVATLSAIQMLYLVEFADWNSQSCIGLGRTNVTSSDSNAATGWTDNMTYHTGMSGTNGESAVQYRGIEDLWGNKDCLVDGLNCQGANVYICSDRTKMADGTNTGYLTYDGIVPDITDTWVSHITGSSNCNWILLPREASGDGRSGSTFCCDQSTHTTSSSWRGLWFGGGFASGSYRDVIGLFCYRMHSGSISTVSSRLIFIP